MLDEPFELPVTYKGEELLFPARLVQLGYVHRFEVTVYDHLVSFEWDDEHNLRALVDPALMDNNKISRDLLHAIAEAIEAVIK